ncbi:glycosyltransferase family A protein [Mesonia ostreae]|uniref:Glycosyltransferase family A protein n=1 Tax=Mesonia ostreae TaxID=861110 RepID=A0ABU2KM00_9FLAO|nr:glycosyltransferase family A protein [Mesonia ostreae]MDT0295729.1 glycosyltransferase family A protein [Mesonia ostreae]
MIFQFLKYVQPGHYFRLKRNSGHFVFPISSELPSIIVENIPQDAAYQSEKATAYDVSWQAIQMGYLGETTTYTHFERVPVADEYRFIRKNFHKAWVIYVLIVRLFSFKNPFKEINGYWKTRNVKRLNYAHNALSHIEYHNFHSDLIARQPLVSVIIPTLNRYPYLKDVLEDLEKQSYTNFEVLVVDQSEPFQKEFYNDFKLKINLNYQEEKALWLARNNAIRNAKGDYILLFDDDSRIASDWIEQHLKSLDFFKADISSGVSISKEGAKLPENYAYFCLSAQLDTGNVLLPKSIFKKIGLFDRQFEKQRMGDGEFGLRSYLADYKNVSNPLAKRLHLKVGSGGLREMGSWDAFRTKKWFSPRPIPSVLYLYRKYFGNATARWVLLKTIPPSVIPYRFKQNAIYMLMGSVFSILISPLILFQVIKSWKLSSKKLKQGPRIGEL